MAGQRKPGPQCQSQGPMPVDDGTAPRTGMPRPGPVPSPRAEKGRTTPDSPGNPAAAPPKVPTKPTVKGDLEVAGLPETVERQLLVGVIYAESGTAAFSGEENA